MIEKNEINKLINELEFFELLDLIDILLMKIQFLERSKRKHLLYCQKRATIQKFRLGSIQEEMDTIHLKIELLTQKLRKFHPIDIE